MKAATPFTLGSLVNLITLAIGLSVGFLLGNVSRSSVHAQAVNVPAQQFEDVSPTMTVGSLGTNLALIHEVDADKVVVNGVDLLQFDQQLLGYLSRRPGAENADFSNIVNASRSTIIQSPQCSKTIPCSATDTREKMMRSIESAMFCGYLFVALAQAKAGFAVQYQFHDKQLPDITVTQPASQVVSPSVYMQLGAQDKALQMNDAKFVAIDQRFKDEDSSVDKLRSEIKPLEDTSVQAHLIFKIISYILGFLMSSGLVGFLINYYKEYLPFKKRSAVTASVGAQSGVMSSLYAASESNPENLSNGSDLTKER